MDEHGILREVLDYEYNERNALLSLAYGNDSSLRREVEVLLEKKAEIIGRAWKRSIRATRRHLDRDRLKLHLKTSYSLPSNCLNADWANFQFGGFRHWIIS